MLYDNNKYLFILSKGTYKRPKEQYQQSPVWWPSELVGIPYTWVIVSVTAHHSRDSGSQEPKPWSALHSSQVASMLSSGILFAY